MIFEEITLFGQPLSFYVPLAEILGIASATIVIRGILGRVAKRIGSRKSDDEQKRKNAAWEKAIRGLFIPAIYLIAALVSTEILKLGGTALKIARDVLVGLAVVFGVRLASALMSLYTESLAERRELSDRAVHIRPITGFLKAVLWILAALFYLDNLGINTSSVLAGLGIGGIAVALAAQTILGDIFAYFIIRFDHPFEIGDFIAFDDFMGSIEQIGFKTTRIRAITGEQLVVSNTAITATRIRNFKRMNRRRVVFTIGVVMETSQETLEEIPTIVRRAIGAQEMTEFDRSHLKGFGSSSIDFESVYYVTVPDYVAYMDAQQAIMLDILSEFRSRGIRLAYPTSTVYLEQAAPS